VVLSDLARVAFVNQDFCIFPFVLAVQYGGDSLGRIFTGKHVRKADSSSGDPFGHMVREFCLFLVV
jgi:hypothetical protein